jgi:hypothetical protein
VAVLPDRGLTIHCAPAENLEQIDVALIGRAEHSIDMAAYILTDWPVMQALARAARRGVKVRVYLDGVELSKDEEQASFSELAATPGVEMRVKRDSALMHLKSYAIDAMRCAPAPRTFPRAPFLQFLYEIVPLRTCFTTSMSIAVTEFLAEKHSGCSARSMWSMARAICFRVVWPCKPMVWCST